MTVTTTPARPAIHPASIRRLVLLALAALLLGSGFAAIGGSGRADAIAPGAPKLLGPIGWSHQAYVGWSLPQDGGKAPTAFKVERYLGDAAQPEKTYVTGGHTTSLVDGNLLNNTVYRYRVQASNQDGAGPWSAKEAVQAKGQASDISPYDTNAGFILRQYQDFLGRKPSPSEMAAASDILAGPGTGADVANLVAYDPQRVGRRFPVLRLYFAFFKRSPDLGGANYWIKKRVNGTNLNTIASNFAGSSEFQTKYGKLGNSEFVTQIYVNVFNRLPDPSGHAYWTTKLDTHHATRGEVMVGFSESNEYAGHEGVHGKSSGRVEASDFFLAVYHRAATNDELNLYYGPHIQPGGTEGSLLLLLSATNSYPT